MTTVTVHLENAKTEAMSLLQHRVAKYGPSLLSTHNLRSVLARRLDVSVNTARLLVVHIVDYLASQGVLEEWDTVGRGAIYQVNAERILDLVIKDEVIR